MILKLCSGVHTHAKLNLFLCLLERDKLFILRLNMPYNDCTFLTAEMKIEHLMRCCWNTLVCCVGSDAWFQILEFCGTFF